MVAPGESGQHAEKRKSARTDDLGSSSLHAERLSMQHDAQPFLTPAAVQRRRVGMLRPVRANLATDRTASGDEHGCGVDGNLNGGVRWHAGRLCHGSLMERCCMHAWTCGAGIDGLEIHPLSPLMPRRNAVSHGIRWKNSGIRKFSYSCLKSI